MHVRTTVVTVIWESSLIPKTLVIWASPSHVTLAIWVRVRVRVTGDAHITEGFGNGDVQNAGIPISL